MTPETRSELSKLYADLQNAKDTARRNEESQAIEFGEQSSSVRYFTGQWSGLTLAMQLVEARLGKGEQ